jgi:glycerate kinase
MFRRVLIVPDKFKGTLTAGDAAEAIARGWRAVWPKDRLTLLPMSDGGDGFGEIMGGLLGAQTRKLKTVDAAGRPLVADWWHRAGSKTAVVETSRIIGLALLPSKRFHPFQLDTFGLGAAFGAAARAGVTRCIAGIGGSASNDGGFGLARALGWKFLDRAGRPITRWTELTQLSRIEAPAKPLKFKDVVVAVDVENPLLGDRGATRVFGPQKGLRVSEFREAESCLKKLAGVFEGRFGGGHAMAPGAGAAGGLGFGLKAFLGARLVSGFGLFARQARLEQRIRHADLVITGEGCLDRSTLMGKGVGRIAECCRRLNVPCIGLAGAVSGGRWSRAGFRAARGLVELAPVEDCLKNASARLEELSAKVAAELMEANR